MTATETSAAELPDFPRATIDAISSRFSSKFLYYYVRGKLGSDPVFRAALARLAGVDGEILDIGCGVGLVGQLFRERGLRNRIVGVDYDVRKIRAARTAAAGLENLSFAVMDAREPMRFRGHVLIFDVLHYFGDDDQRKILGNAVDYSSEPGSIVMIRDAIRDGSWRYKLTWLEERFATGIGWLKGTRLNFPTLDLIAASFREGGYEEKVTPLWGRTPFNNHLITFVKRT